MRNMKKTAALMLGAMMVLTACSKPAETPSASAETGKQTVKETVSTEVTGKTEEASETAAETESGASGEEVTILVAAAASLEYSYEEELIPMFEAANPGIKVEGTYDSSGKLQTQIEEGLEADVFMSAAMKQMNALKEEKLVDDDSIVELLENKIVLITGKETQMKAFEDIVNAEIIALGDPESVPAGQYAKEALTTLGLWDQAEAKASFGTNVTEVLNWVAEGSAEAGIVYATDAAANGKVTVVAEAPEGSLSQKVIYPVAVVSASEKKEAAKKFVEFLQSEEALAVFEQYGFTAN